MTKKTLFAIGVGGIVGSSLRFGIGLLISVCWRGSFPIATLLINYLGCFALGMFCALITKKDYREWLCRAVDTGLIGSFTTFSTFSVESMQLLNSGSTLLALLYIGLSIAGGLILAQLGYAWLKKRDRIKETEPVC